MLSDNPDVTIELSHQSGKNGMLYVDATSSVPTSAKISITYKNFARDTHVYFAPNCKIQVMYCLAHPIQSSWYVRSFVGDKTVSYTHLDVYKRQQEYYEAPRNP